jgi:solute carrier family 31 (copper transporter), member 1
MKMNFLMILQAPFVTSNCIPSEYICLNELDVPSLNIKLCSDMPGMPGCSMLKTCRNKDDFCDDKVIHSIICQEMPKMAACSGYVANCAAAPICNLLPSSKVVTKQIYSICNEMDMPGCDRCKLNDSSVYSDCDLLSTYANLCTQMPRMGQCSTYNAMCAANTSLPWCGNSNKLAPPTMKMFFHGGISDYLLFESWVPRTPFQYFLAILFSFSLAVTYEGFQVLIFFLDIKWLAPEEIISDTASSEGLINTAPAPLLSHICGYSKGKRGIILALLGGFLRTFATAIGYALMLVAMTFNIGLFLSVVIGFGFGSFLFSPIIKLSSFGLLSITSSTGSECH